MQMEANNYLIIYKRRNRVMKKQFQKFLSCACAAGIVLAMTACGGNSTTATAVKAAGTTAKAGTATTAAKAAPKTSDGKTVTIRWASNVAQGEIDGNKTPMAIAINTWIKTVQEKSNGTIKVDLHAGSSLASGTDNTIQGLLNGAFEIAQLSTGSWSDYSSAFAPLNVPYLFTDYKVAHAVMDGDVGKQMITQLEKDVNVHVLCFADIGYRHVTSNKGVIKSPADMKGLKIRTMSDDIQVSSFKDLGCAVTPMNISELFSGLQTGLVDAEENPLSTIISNKFYEVQKYCTLTRHSYTTTIFFMNPTFYNGLSAEQKAAVEEANKASTAACRAVLESTEKESRTELEQKGMQITDLTADEMAAFQKAVQPTWDKVKKQMGDDNWNALIKAVDAAKK
jgi:tripartite ATP-independent transporter DctP family solute receptor